MTQATPKAPRHLAAATRTWWEDVVSGWVLEPHHVRVLTLAAETWDRIAEARQIIAKEGLTLPTRDGGSKLHPAVRVEQDGKVIFARLLRELDLDVAPPASARPPALRSVRGGRHAS